MERFGPRLSEDAVHNGPPSEGAAFTLVNSLLTAIVRADGDALVMHVGERPYVVASSGPVELSSRPLTLDAVAGMLGQLLPLDARRALEELGAVEQELPRAAAGQGDRFTVIAARGGDDIWIEVRRHRRPKPSAAAQPITQAAPVPEAPTVAAPEPAVAEPLPVVPVVQDAPAPEPQVASPVLAVAEPTAAPVAEAGPEPAPAVPAVAPPIEPEPVAASEVAALPEIAAAVPEPVPVSEPERAPEPEAVAEPRPPAASEVIFAPVAVNVVPEPIVASPQAEAVQESESAVTGLPEALFGAVPAAASAPTVPAPARAVLEPAAVPAPPLESAPAPSPAASQPPAVLPPFARPPIAARPAISTRSSVPLMKNLPAFVPPPRPVAAPKAAEVPPAPPREGALLRPLVATPIVERPAPEPFQFDEPVQTEPAAEAAEPRPMAAASPEPAVVLPLARNPIRMEPQPGRTSPTRIAGIDRLLRLSAARGANTLFLMAQARPAVRVDGEIAVLEGEPVLSAHEVESMLLDLAPERTREALEAGLGTEWMSEVPEVGRIRCQSFRDHRGPGGIFRMISNRPTTAEQLGLAREIQSLCAEPEGLILVAGPRASGKSTLVTAMVDLINRTRNDYVVTIETQVKSVHESRGCLISQREVRGGNEDMAVVVRGALRENPDVLVIEDMRSPEVIRLALEAMEAGHLVIGAVSAHGATTAIGKILDQAPEERRGQMRLALAEGLRGVVSQVLLRKSVGGRVAAREVLLNLPSIANLIAEGRISQLPLAIDSGRKHGMVPLNDALAAFVQSGVVDVKEAYRKAFERQAFLAVLRREGVDTSFVERLA
jgi:twitching motility protein PilT